MEINQATVDLVKRWEGFKAEAYLCPANVWTIGYGTTSRAGIGVTVTRGMRRQSNILQESEHAYVERDRPFDPSRDRARCHHSRGARVDP